MHQIVGLGEILWDVFPDGPRFGGAPANFACSAAALAQRSVQVSMVSAVGDDDLGSRALDSLRQRGVDTSMVQISTHATGRVDVELDDAGVPSYRFAEDSAWDHLSWNATVDQLAGRCDAVCFGTLGQRSEQSRETIRRFVQATPESALRILDINLRKPYFDDDLIRQSLAIANVLKLNDDELSVLEQSCGAEGSEVEVMKQLADQYGLQTVALTRGERGAIVWTQDEFSDRPGNSVDVVDTVGAGDAFTAALTLGMLAGKHVDAINEMAIATASYVCSRPGATMQFPGDLLQA